MDEKSLELYRPNEAWLAVRKDLLDQQIIDTSGRKVVRVNDIDLSEQRTDGSVELRVTHVDVGLTGAVRRLLQGLVTPSGIRRNADCPSTGSRTGRRIRSAPAGSSDRTCHWSRSGPTDTPGRSRRNAGCPRRS